MDINNQIESTTREALAIVDELQGTIKKILNHQLKRLESIHVESYDDTPAREKLFANVKIQRDRIQSKINEL